MPPGASVCRSFDSPWPRLGRIQKRPLGGGRWADALELLLGKRRIVDISKSDIELFQAQLLKQVLAPKTVNDIFNIVRGVWPDAFGDGILKANPLDRISNVGSDVDLEHAAPFSRTEIELIGKTPPRPPQTPG